MPTKRPEILPSVEAILELTEAHGPHLIWIGQIHPSGPHIYPRHPRFGLVRPLLYTIVSSNGPKRRVQVSCREDLCVSLDHLYIARNKRHTTLAQLYDRQQRVFTQHSPEVAVTQPSSQAWKTLAKEFISHF